ncbi:hypothetical protein ABIC90_001228 [Variovorax boronicumulans]
MRRAVSSGLWLDRVLCALLALLSAAALCLGLLNGDHAVAGLALFGLAGAVWIACVLFDDAKRRRSLAVRAALERAWR